MRGRPDGGVVVQAGQLPGDILGGDGAGVGHPGHGPDRSEAGGLQFTAQQFGAAVGTALIGAVLITGLITAFSSKISSDSRISADVNQQVGVRLEGQVSFVSTDQVRSAAEEAGIEPATTDALVSNYADAQLKALKTALLAAGFIVLASFFTTGSLPSRPSDAAPAVEGEATPAA